MREVYNSLVKKLNQHYKENNPNRILRRNILGMGILYCLSSNIGKIKILFDIFSTDDKFTKSEELDDFLLTLFILSSYAIIAARTKVAKSSNKFKPLSNNELKEAIGTSELSDCEKLLQVFNQSFFDIFYLLYFSHVDYELIFFLIFLLLIVLPRFFPFEISRFLIAFHLFLYILIKNNLLIMNLKINLMFKIMDLDGFLFLKVLD